MMKLIVAQKHMNLPRLIVVALSAIVALSGNATFCRSCKRNRETVDEHLPIGVAKKLI